MFDTSSSPSANLSTLHIEITALTVTNSQSERVIDADCARMIEGGMIDLNGWYRDLHRVTGSMAVP